MSSLLGDPAPIQVADYSGITPTDASITRSVGGGNANEQQGIPLSNLADLATVDISCEEIEDDVETEALLKKPLLCHTHH